MIGREQQVRETAGGAMPSLSAAGPGVALSSTFPRSVVCPRVHVGYVCTCVALGLHATVVQAPWGGSWTWWNSVPIEWRPHPGPRAALAWPCALQRGVPKPLPVCAQWCGPGLSPQMFRAESCTEKQPKDAITAWAVCIAASLARISRRHCPCHVWFVVT